MRKKLNVTEFKCMEKKTILFVYKGHFSYLPPFQALVEALLSTNKYKLKVICSEEEPDMDDLYKNENLEFIHYYTLEPRTGIASRVRNHLKTANLFKKRVKHDLDSLQYDILWIIHERTAVGLNEILEGRKYILTCYEFRDTNEPDLHKPLISLCQNAQVNVVCEFNRAWISRISFGLKQTPMVLPNKPFKHPLRRGLANDLLKPSEEKIILYQGIITRERNLDGMCKAISSLKGFKLVFMGKKTDYYEELKKKYPNIEYIGFAKSPKHLNVTSNAYIGLVTYEPQDINCVYCAPNKIWEYAGFGIPMIANNIPGLVYTVGSNKCGICTDTDSEAMIVSAVKEIDANYEEYSRNAKDFYDSCDINFIVNDIIDAYCK